MPRRTPATRKTTSGPRARPWSCTRCPPEMEPASAKLAAVRAYCQANPRAVLFDEPGEALFDVASLRTLTLRAGDLQSVELLEDQDTRAPYLRLMMEDGRQ